MDRLNIAAITDISGAYGRRVLSGIGRFASQHGCWSLTMMPTWEQEIGGLIREVQGLIVQVNSPWLIRALQKSACPVVNVADTFPDTGFPTVISDNAAIGQLGAEHLLDRGFRNLAFLSTEGWYAAQRLEGFCAAAQRAGVCVRTHCLAGSPPSAEVDINRWLSELPKPVGLMAAHDVLARAAARFCRALDLRVPVDVAILGVDNDELICELYDVPLTSVAVSAERIGFCAASMLADAIAGKKPQENRLLIPPAGIVARQSTDVLALSDTLVAQAVQHIHEHLRQRLTVQQLLRSTNLSRRQLEQRFLKALGRTPAAEVRRQRVAQAKHLLATTDVAIATIASDCGFPDAPRLTKVFRRETGMTPLQYRMRNRLR